MPESPVDVFLPERLARVGREVTERSRGDQALAGWVRALESQLRPVEDAIRKGIPLDSTLSDERAQALLPLVKRLAATPDKAYGRAWREPFEVWPHEWAAFLGETDEARLDVALEKLADTPLEDVRKQIVALVARDSRLFAIWAESVLHHGRPAAMKWGTSLSLNDKFAWTVLATSLAGLTPQFADVARQAQQLVHPARDALVKAGRLSAPADPAALMTCQDIELVARRYFVSQPRTFSRLSRPAQAHGAPEAAAGQAAAV